MPADEWKSRVTRVVNPEPPTDTMTVKMFTAGVPDAQGLVLDENMLQELVDDRNRTVAADNEMVDTARGGKVSVERWEYREETQSVYLVHEHESIQLDGVWVDSDYETQQEAKKNFLYQTNRAFRGKYTVDYSKVWILFWSLLTEKRVNAGELLQALNSARGVSEADIVMVSDLDAAEQAHKLVQQYLSKPRPKKLR